MNNRVLHDRLEQQLRCQIGLHSRIDVVFHPESVGKACMLDAHIGFDLVNLILQLVVIIAPIE
ncbi:hypothetical protein D3C85_1714080 [compost metagenome]